MNQNSGFGKIVSYVLVFVVGFIVCALVLHSMYGPVRSSDITNAVAPSHMSAVPMGKDGKNPVADAAAQVEKYVVNIDTVGQARVPIEGLGGGFFGFQPPERVMPTKGQASGVIISPDGYILTNNHVVANTSKVMVTLYDKKQYTARIIGRDPKTDLAVIKIDQTGLPAAVPADSKKLRVGDWVVAVGNPLGLGSTVTVGVVSATERENLQIQGTVLERAIQTDAAINLGNSGGALADIEGHLVGINTAIASAGPGGGSIGIGFAIPSDTAMAIAKQIIANGKVVRPWIGISYMPLNDDVRRELKQQGVTDLPSINGALIRDVAQGSPADRAGLLSLDVITVVNGKKVDSSKVIADAVKNAKVGQILDMVVWHARTGNSSKIAVRLGEMPTDMGQ